MIPYTITEYDEARNRCLLVQAKVERQLRGRPAPSPANHAPLRSVERAKATIRLDKALAAYCLNHPLSPYCIYDHASRLTAEAAGLTPRATAEHILNEGPTEV